MIPAHRVFRSVLIISLSIAASTNAQTTYTWSGGNSGNWDKPASWSPASVPTTADYVEVSSGIATLTENVEVARFEISNLGVVRGSFDLTVTDSLIWSGGGSGFETFRDSGAVVVAESATMRLVEPTIRFQVSAARTIVNNGTTIWEGSGVWQGLGKFVNNGVLILAYSSSTEHFFVFSNQTDAFTNTANGVIRQIGTGELVYGAGMVNDGAVEVDQAY